MRHEDDFYETPEWCVHQLLEQEGFSNPATPNPHREWIDPCVGSGALVRAVESYVGAKENFTTFDLKDIYHQEGHTLIVGNFLEYNHPPDYKPDLLGLKDLRIIANPPYKDAENFVRKCYVLYPEAYRMYFLLRLSFLASAGRKEFYEYLGIPDVLVLASRPSFTYDGKTDSSEYAWFCWSNWKITENHQGRGLHKSPGKVNSGSANLRRGSIYRLPPVSLKDKNKKPSKVYDEFMLNSNKNAGGSGG